jgi:uncharacterized OsmC-like protein
MKVKDILQMQGINIEDYKVALKKKFLQDKKKRKKHASYPVDTISQVRNSLNKDMP